MYSWVATNCAGDELCATKCLRILVTGEVLVTVAVFANFYWQYIVNTKAALSVA